MSKMEIHFIWRADMKRTEFMAEEEDISEVEEDLYQVCGEEDFIIWIGEEVLIATKIEINMVGVSKISIKK